MGSRNAIEDRTDGRQGNLLVSSGVEGVTLHPKPAFRETATPVLLCVSGGVLKFVALAPPLDPARCSTQRHHHLSQNINSTIYYYPFKKA
jgi:hypothetical protein